MSYEKYSIPLMRAIKRSGPVLRLLGPMMRPFNPFDPRIIENPYPTYERLRSRGPIVEHRSANAWLVTGYRECHEVLAADLGAVGNSAAFREVTPYTRLDPDVRDSFVSSMLFVDPPDHTRLRQLVSRAFTPAKIGSLEPYIAKLAGSLLDQLAPGSDVELMNAYCTRLPTLVIGFLLGISPHDWEYLHRTTTTLIQFTDVLKGFDALEMNRVARSFRDYLEREFERRRSQPSDDLIGRLVRVEEGGDVLSTVELHAMVNLLMIAGHETTSSLLGSSLVALARHPAQRARLVTDPTLDASAIEELLRYEPPFQFLIRLVRKPTAVAGVQLKPGRQVFICLAAANRDPAVFSAPHQLQLERPGPRPISFGFGIHHCLGAALSRLEARVGLRVFLDRFPNYVLDERRLVWKHNSPMRGPSALYARLPERARVAS